MQMMKKTNTFIFLVLMAASTISLAACKQNSTDSKVFLDYGYIRENAITNITDLTELTYSKVKAKVESNESFMLVIYNATCSCWGKFQPVITKYINETNAKVEYIDIDEFSGETETFGLYLEKIAMPSVAVFKRGKLVKQPYYKANDPATKMFENYEAFKQWSDENIVLPKAYFLEKSVLDSYIDENKEFSLYISKESCPDCQNINYNVLYDNNDAHETYKNNLYIFDIEPYMVDMEVYKQIKKDYGLSPDNNPIFGYELYGGAVPTFQHRKGSEIADMITVLNDIPNALNKTVSSYFTEERVNHMTFIKSSGITATLDGMELSDEQFENWGSYSSEFYKEYHYPITKLFFDYYLN